MDESLSLRRDMVHPSHDHLVRIMDPVAAPRPSEEWSPDNPTAPSMSAKTAKLQSETHALKSTYTNLDAVGSRIFLGKLVCLRSIQLEKARSDKLLLA